MPVPSAWGHPAPYRPLWGYKWSVCVCVCVCQRGRKEKDKEASVSVALVVWTAMSLFTII